MPEITWFEQPLPRRGLAAPGASAAAALAAADWPARLAGPIAIAVGSRGIGRLPELVAAVVEAVRQRGGEPLVVPAMGSHGAITAAGQEAVLGRLGVTAATVGAPVATTMETVVLGQTESGLPVHLDRIAAEAAGIVLLNRIKPHTSFRGRFESGLLKQLAVGLGNGAGAAVVHQRGIEALAASVEEVGRYALTAAPVLLGLAVLEDAYDEPAAIEALAPSAILEREPRLLEQARELLPHLPFDELDILVVERLGKDISGTGMDPNVIGRRGIRGQPDHPQPRIGLIVALDLSDGSGGNALGVGLADLTTQRLVDRLDPVATYANALTTGLLERVKIPLVCDDEATALATALALAGRRDEAVRLVRIGSTKELTRLGLSPVLAAEARARGWRESAR